MSAFFRLRHKPVNLHDNPELVDQVLDLEFEPDLGLQFLETDPENNAPVAQVSDNILSVDDHGVGLAYDEPIGPADICDLIQPKITRKPNITWEESPLHKFFQLGSPPEQNERVLPRTPGNNRPLTPRDRRGRKKHLQDLQALLDQPGSSTGDSRPKQPRKTTKRPALPPSYGTSTQAYSLLTRPRRRTNVGSTPTRNRPSAKVRGIPRTPATGQPTPRPTAAIQPQLREPPPSTATSLFSPVSDEELGILEAEAAYNWWEVATDDENLVLASPETSTCVDPYDTLYLNCILELAGSHRSSVRYVSSRSRTADGRPSTEPRRNGRRRLSVASALPATLPAAPSSDPISAATPATVGAPTSKNPEEGSKLSIPNLLLTASVDIPESHKRTEFLCHPTVGIRTLNFGHTWILLRSSMSGLSHAGTDERTSRAKILTERSPLGRDNNMSDATIRLIPARPAEYGKYPGTFQVLVSFTKSLQELRKSEDLFAVF
ncbi:unnamed protein product [Bemisia tabaci]|uniref:Uncharacterized protein n=1 Tax=Bemisia tabaci TaxID=7038 RepID=A0A9P0AAV5_BEMTA|nr:unnamed protein product [Bemisia tabaci]